MKSEMDKIQKEKTEKLMTNTVVVVMLALLCNALWGSAFPGIKLGCSWFEAASTGDKILFAGMRFIIAGIMVIAYYSIVKHKFIYPKKSSLGMVFALCMTQTVLQYFFFYIGLSNTSGVKASVVEGSNVFVAILVASLIFRKERLNVRVLIGCVLGFAGVIMVNLGEGGFDAGVSFMGEGFVFLSTIAYAFSTVFIKEFSEKEDSVMLSGWQFLTGGFILAAIGLLLGGSINLNVSVKAYGMLLYLGFLSAFAYTLWGILLKYNSISKIAVFGFTNPVFGVLFSAILIGEGSLLDIRCLIALVLVCVGIFIANMSRRKHQEYEKIMK